MWLTPAARKSKPTRQRRTENGKGDLMQLNSIWKFFAACGPVMWPILFFSVAMLAIFAERCWRFARLRPSPPSLPIRVAEHLSSGRREEALAAARADQGAVGRILCAASEVNLADREALETVIISAQQAEVRELDRYLPSLAMIGNLAPALGLLGTVTGMIKAFMVIQEMGGKVNAAVLAGGIWEAMLTTAFGLIVALPAMAAHGYLSSRVDRFHDDLQNAAVAFIKALSVNGAR
jgi:biopolymer transport protein ExbB